MPDKMCSRCKQAKPLSSFSKASRAADGLQPWCRDGTNAWRRETRIRVLDARPLTADGEKWCRRCRLIKQVDDFGPNRRTRDGRQSYCLACYAEIYREKREAAGKVSRPAEIPQGYKFCRSCERVLPLSS